MNVFNPGNKALQIKMIYYKEHFVPSNNHRFVFKLKNSFAARWEYVGIISTYKQTQTNSEDSNINSHQVLRFINTTRIKDIRFLLGIDDLEDFEENEFKCPSMKEAWLSHLMKHAYIATDCKPTEVPGCVRARDLNQLFQNNFTFLKLVMKAFGFEVSIGELGFNRAILNSYRTAFKEFPYILRAISQVESMITPQNSVNQAILLVTADKREKFKCENILDLKEECAKSNSTLDCLTESQARALINYMIVHYMADTRTILPTETIEGKDFICLVLWLKNQFI
jgi:hypothetical protein